jgi:8-oxo-dGTP pyrophosphatase MutT (NUDIX family)
MSTGDSFRKVTKALGHLLGGDDALPPRRQSGVIPYRLGTGGLEVLLVTRRSGKDWIIPKGQIEPDMTEQDSAAKEAMEEAGVTGRAFEERAGLFQYLKGRAMLEVVVYDLEVLTELEKWPEQSDRERRWATPEQAAELVKNQGLSDLLRGLRERLDRRGKPAGESGG